MIEATIRELIKLFRGHIEENTVLSAGSIVEIAKLPVIVLNGPVLQEKKRLMRDGERLTAINLSTSSAIREIPPRWYDLKFDVSMSCESNLDLIAMFKKCIILSQSFPLITANNSERERRYLWAWNIPPYASMTPNISQVYHGRGEIIVYDVEVYSNIKETWPLIEQVRVEIENDVIEVKA